MITETKSAASVSLDTDHHNDRPALRLVPAGGDEEGEPGRRAGGEDGASYALAPLGLGGELERLGEQLDVFPVRGWGDRFHGRGDEFAMGRVEPGAELKGAELRVREEVPGDFSWGGGVSDRRLCPADAVVPGPRPVRVPGPVGDVAVQELGDLLWCGGAGERHFSSPIVVRPCRGRVR